MTEQSELNWEDLSKQVECPQCENKAPKRQIDNIGICERCSMEGKVKTKDGTFRNPEHNLVDKWKLETTNAENKERTQLP